MTPELAFNGTGFESRAVSPYLEMGAYEALWMREKASFRSLAKYFQEHPGSLPSDFVTADKAHECAQVVMKRFREAGVGRFGVRVHGAAEYPQGLRAAAHPVELLYYQGWWDLAASPSVAVVGTRKPSPEGLARTRRLVRELVKGGFTIASGLAAGIDRMAHKTALEEGGRTMAVIGTPLSHVYPRQHAELQRLIARDFLLVSQVPLMRYERQDYRMNRFFFPERNATMSALTQGTIIVEAGETSGTLAQARAAIDQGRRLFILDNCFRNPRLTWPEKFASKGGIRVLDYDDIQGHLSPTVH